MAPLTHKIVRDLRHLAGPLAAVAVVMAAGQALFISLRSMHGYLRRAQAAYYADYQFADVFARPHRAPRSLHSRLVALPGVASLDLRIVVDVQIDVRGLDEPGTGRLISLPLPGGPRVNRLHLREGRLPAVGDPDAVLVNEAFAQANHLRVGDAFGAILNGHRRTLRIAGTVLSPEFVYAVRPGEVFPDNRRFGILWMDEKAVAAAFDMTGAFNDLVMTVRPARAVPDVLAALDAHLARYGGAGAFDREDQTSHRFLSDEIAETQVTSVLLPAIFLGVTAFLLNLVFGRLVALQRGQIAVLKAFGYGDLAVGMHYLELAAVPIAIGSLGGTLLGLRFAALTAELYTRFFAFPLFLYAPDWSVIAVALMVSTGAALAGVARSVHEAVSLPPAEAMQPPSPPSFRHGPIERLGLRFRATVPVQIALRNIERRPGRAGFAVVGTGSAVALVVAAWFLFDAIQLARDTHFYRVQRDDVMVVFQDLRPAEASRALARLPGVRRVEPFRAAPVRLQAGPRRARATAIGVDPDGRLRRIADRHGTIHHPARGGLVVTTFLARRLGIEAGDRVLVEVLEGGRPARELEVSGLVDELIGTSIYLETDALNDLTRHGRVRSGAFLAVDADRLPALCARLRGMPAITGVSVRRAMMDGFDRTFAESFTIPIRMLVAFACVIAAGIVYNGLSVAFSERGRELATLRVLGFSPHEVEQVLIGEQALLTGLGLPLGFGLGFLLSLLIAVRFETEMFRLPLAIEPSTYLLAAGIVVLASVLSALSVRLRLARLDLVEALKARE